MPLSVLVCICFSFCSVNEHWFEFNLANFRKLLNKLVKKLFCTSAHVFFKRSCCRGMIRCRFVLQQLHKPDVGFARFFYSSARENSSHVCIYNNWKHNLRVNLSPPPAITWMQFSVIWFFRNLGHFKYRIFFVNHYCNSQSLLQHLSAWLLDFCLFSLCNQFAFCWFLSNLIIHESSKPDNPSWVARFCFGD